MTASEVLVVLSVVTRENGGWIVTDGVHDTYQLSSSDGRNELSCVATLFMSNDSTATYINIHCTTDRPS